MNTTHGRITLALLGLATSMISFDALAQTGVWVLRDTNGWGGYLASSADGTKLVATSDNHNSLHTSTDSGVTWTLRNSNRSFRHVASSADGAKLVALAYMAGIYLSTDAGVTWSDPVAWPTLPQGVASSADGTKLVVIYNTFGIITSTNSGTTWTTQNLGGDPGLDLVASVASSADGTKLVIGTGNHVFTSTNSGVTWTACAGAGERDWGGVASSADGTKLVALDTGYANNGLGSIYTSTDSGATWTPRAQGTNWTAVASSADGTRLVAARGVYNAVKGDIYISTDSGVTWTPSGPAGVSGWASVASSADGNKLVAADESGRIYTYAAPLANDLCAGAIAVSSGESYSMDTANATSAGDPIPSCPSSFGNGVWFTYTPTGSGPVLVSSCGSSFDTVLAVYTGTCGSLTALACNDDNGPACAGTRASVAFWGSAGTTYHILAGGYNGYQGSLQIAAQLQNDQCSGAVSVALPGSYSMNTSDATQSGDPGTTLCQWKIGKSVWFRFTPASSGPVTVNTCGSDFDTVLQLFTGSCGALVGSHCNDDSGYGCNSFQASIAFNATGGTTYFIMAGGYDESRGNLNLSLATSQARALTVNSTPTSGVFIEATPADLNGLIGLVTSSSLSYADGTAATLTAPDMFGDLYFEKWQLDGVDLTTSLSAAVTMAANHVLTAVYVPVLITSPPVGGTANAGNSFAFSVTASESETLSYQWQHEGTNLPGATANTLVVTNLDPLDAGDYRVVVTRASGSVTSSVAALAVLPALGLALDTFEGPTWTTGGGLDGWYRQTDVSHDGTDSARCGPFDGIISPWMQTTVTGPATLTFYWRYPRPPQASDYLALSVNGVVWFRSGSANAAWYQQTVYLAEGSQVLRWTCVKGGRPSGGPGYVDQINLAPGGTAPFIATQPAPQTVVAGSNAVFAVVASGTPSFTYQWQSSGVAIASATNSSLTLSNVHPNQAANYSVVIANGYGSAVTSSNALLTVTTLPLPVALDYAGPAWTTSGNQQWFGQVGTTRDGVDAAQSGAMTNLQQCHLEMNLVGPGTLSFWWKVASEANCDYLRFYVDGVLRTNVSGEVDWSQQTLALPVGTHTLRWSYTKDGSVSAGLDAAWLDRVSYDGPPYLVINPLPPQQVRVLWPASAIGFSLEYATNLAPPSFWQFVGDTPVVVNDDCIVTNNTGSLPRFYRLKK